MPDFPSLGKLESRRAGFEIEISSMVLGDVFLHPLQDEKQHIEMVDRITV